MSIVKKTIVPQEIEVFDSEGNSLGMCNEYEFMDIRIQIMEQEADGYYVMFEDHKTKIDRYGTLEKFPDGMFDTLGNGYLKLFQGE